MTVLILLALPSSQHFPLTHQLVCVFILFTAKCSRKLLLFGFLAEDDEGNVLIFWLWVHSIAYMARLGFAESAVLFSCETSGRLVRRSNFWGFGDFSRLWTFNYSRRVLTSIVSGGLVIWLGGLLILALGPVLLSKLSQLRHRPQVNIAFIVRAFAPEQNFIIHFRFCYLLETHGSRKFWMLYYLVCQ